MCHCIEEIINLDRNVFRNLSRTLLRTTMLLLFPQCLPIPFRILMNFIYFYIRCVKLKLALNRFLLYRDDVFIGYIVCYCTNCISSLVAGQKSATSILNSFSEMTWEEKLSLEKKKFKCLEHITIAFV